MQDGPGLGHAVTDPGAVLDHVCHPGQRPHVGGKAVRPRAGLQRLLDIGELRVSEPGQATGPSRSHEGGSSASAPRLVPGRRRLSRDAERGGHIGLALSAPEHVRGAHPTSLQGFEITAGTDSLGCSGLILDPGLGGARHMDIIAQ